MENLRGRKVRAARLLPSRFKKWKFAGSRRGDERGHCRTPGAEGVPQGIVRADGDRECREDAARRAERETLSYERYPLKVISREYEQRRKSRVRRL